MCSLIRGYRRFFALFIGVLLPLSFIFHSAWAANEVIFFAPQAGTPAAIRNFVDIESGCNWSGVAGQVFDLQGEPASGLVVKVWGNLEGKEILLYAVTGGSLFFGSGGYFFKLADHNAASSGTLRMQLLDITGQELSPPLQFDTFADCTRNLIILNIREVNLQNQVFFPVIRR